MPDNAPDVQWLLAKSAKEGGPSVHNQGRIAGVAPAYVRETPAPAWGLKGAGAVADRFVPQRSRDRDS